MAIYVVREIVDCVAKVGSMSQQISVPRVWEGVFASFKEAGGDASSFESDIWVNKQKEIGGNIKPGQGTRERFKKEIEKELPQPKPEEKPSLNPEDDVEDDKNLQENIKRIKSLMLF